MKKIFTFLLLVSFGSMMAAKTAKATCPTITASASPSTICSGDVVTILLHSDIPNTTYTWTAVRNGVTGTDSGSFPGNSGLDTIITLTLHTTTANTGQVVYTITPFADNCTGNPVTVTITVHPAPTATVYLATPTICPGNTAMLMFTGTPNATIYFTENGAPQNITLSASGTATIATSPLTSNTIYQLTHVTSSTGCYIPLAASVIVTVNPLPTAAITSNQTVCAGDGTMITFIGTPNSTITYNINGGANQNIILNSSGTATLFTGILTSTTVYNLVSVSSSTGCSTSLAASATVTVNPIPSISGSSVVCEGTLIQLLGTGIPAASNPWISSNPAVATVNPTGLVFGMSAGITTITFRNDNGCTVTQTITVNPTPTVTVNSPTICSGSSATITATPGTSGSYSYTWAVPAGAPNPGNVQSFTTTTAGTYTVVMIASNGCENASASGTVTVLPSPDITATATNQSISSGGSTDISLSSNSPGATYQWTVTQNNVTGATSGSGNIINQLLSLVNTALPGSVTYTITSSMSGGACSRNVTDITIMVNPNLGTNDFNSPNFIVSPNPVTDILNIKNNQTINKVTAFNQLGQMVLQKEYNNNEVQLDFSALKTGIYFISVDSDKKQSTFKIAKN